MLFHFILKDILRKCQMLLWGTQCLLPSEVSERQLNKKAGILQSSWSTSGPCDCQFGDILYLLGHLDRCSEGQFQILATTQKQSSKLQLLIVTELILTYAFSGSLLQGE